MHRGCRATTIGHGQIGDFLTAPRKNRVRGRHLLHETIEFGKSSPPGDSGIIGRIEEEKIETRLLPQLTSGRDRAGADEI